MTVPDDIKPGEVDLAVRADLLREELYADPILGYEQEAIAEQLARIARELTYMPLRRPA
ncbi:hypothetical protein GOFOIKOB_4516 [Methylobacterium tardum]|uniref:Uncharacterized protein n=1 Tax=Methylobacterium tardum TaxID=374432 RepID=A0AA37WUL0_9HYPH|nr:hypothetical protein [Methylobacterium tardum]URD39457.1 hypothetical protein M6G65_14230 [Methylobacterium tardum]GJE51457.1 hypothetical protein GOFOIKOB_4516 [Methylobacterium tardum]GLS73646.1 hypothetical protein GCM10007890_56610 [Methylobacterium tardum]